MLLVNVGVVIPVPLLFTNQLYCTLLPALLVVAVYVSAVPIHALSADAVTTTVGCRLLLTTIVMVDDVATCVVAQLAELVNIHFTTSPLLKLDDVNVLLLVPAVLLFTIHR